MSSWTIHPRFDTVENAEILRFLRERQPSAHSDVAAELIRSARGLAGVSHYCPDPEGYAFVLLHRADHSILGLAFGQSRIAFRLPEAQIAELVHEGASRATELGRDWVFVEPWTNEETLETSRRRLAQWCSSASDHAD